MLWQALNSGHSLTDLGRLETIAGILIRHGFGDMVRRMGLSKVLEKAGRALHWADAEAYAHMPPPQRVRRALEELGPTFVKLGQILSTRVDQFEPEWIAEFSQLQDHAPPCAWAEVQAQLCEDLGAPPESVFAQFDAEPLAAGSIAQVHRARLADHDAVRHPHQHLAHLADDDFRAQVKPYARRSRGADLASWARTHQRRQRGLDPVAKGSVFG